MHDLDTIISRNAAACERAITTWRGAGHHVVCAYDGLHLVAAEPHADVGAAVGAANKLGGVVGVSVSVLPPFPGSRADDVCSQVPSFASVDDYLAYVGRV